MKNKLKLIIKQAQPVIPVMVIDHLDQAVPMGHALKKGGITVFEITLRSKCALDAIRLLKKELPDCIVGAGTVINREQFLQVIDAGGDYIVTPGITDELFEVAKETGLPFIPGVATASEVMQAVSYGFETLKFFPAEQSGGVAMLKSLAGPFGHIKFCPTGGINEDNVRSYLSLPNVACVGGSWILPKDAVATGDWETVTKLTKAASSL
ncbi:bifunctional 4-hydroxy-2-oxoglutarate aldolase/2-dehydro-3-deoxy-phosphogluconate aldolase [Sansalvadorimonas sp. 2012CJ34-2]|uniref:2-dehydro-3-deoxy-phosphogluconate aldolase n=1 Tax=Parendozoicomonas callyspongiae TaxID=2942213 RepID=A0ABT0PHC8_9GAMM|nr:bifunctional 4-hydroxy-2-oxoglutarate aldolase/2-dehydro-3-deoxy-phosphogluconate aldolase [Sansalvadorimonas sp. 2012CJ34-2]MCL6270416.1 bifunctional 4-hydroxy-2-oxoglutarate aldolase/2-dehydro-3-deoxy-phosphogluconate aldolase [Sansalvadorimonas sp. 2012CJ34-2]